MKFSRKGHTGRRRDIKKQEEKQKDCWIGRKEVLRAGGILLCTIVLASGLYIVDKQKADLSNGGKIERNGYGSGNKIEELYVQAGGEREKIVIEIPPQTYTEEELETLWPKAREALDRVILGENHSGTEVRKALVLPAKVPGMEIAVRWEFSRYDVIDLQGNILSPEEQGSDVWITGYMKCQEREAVYEKAVTVYPKEQLSVFAQKAKKAAEDADKDQKSEKYLELPGEVEGKKVTWEKKYEGRAAPVLGIGILAAVISLLLTRQEEEKQRKLKEEELILDYPELLHQFTLLTGAGMTVRAAWRMIVESAEQSDRELIRQMRCTLREMQSGISEEECYERFGMRCGNSAYMKFGAMLSQNLKKGAKGMGILLRTEAVIAFEDRKRQAKQQGEEAGTKLLMPMFLMLGVVLLIVVVPAFFSMSI